MTVFVMVIGSFLTYFKYKLDKASYNKDLFEKRYEIFLQLKDIMIRIVKDRNQDPMTVPEWENLTLKAYALFGDETYAFIKKFTLMVSGHKTARPLDELERQKNFVRDDPNLTQ